MLLLFQLASFLHPRFLLDDCIYIQEHVQHYYPMYYFTPIVYSVIQAENSLRSREAEIHELLNAFFRRLVFDLFHFSHR